MSNHGTELPLGDSERALIVEFWNQVALCDEPRGASRELLEELERTVTDCLYCKPADLLGARAATAKAIFIFRSDGEN